MVAGTSDPEMKKAIQGIIAGINANPTLQPNLINPGYIYSAYISTLIIAALQNKLGLRAKVKNPDNGPFRFPLGPTKISSGSFSWYEIESPKGIWELHLCCECCGVSHLMHELDILFLSKAEADSCRSMGRCPETTQILFLVECKNVGTVEYGLGREFLGLCLEFPIFDDHGLWTWRGNEKSGALVK